MKISLLLSQTKAIAAINDRARKSSWNYYNKSLLLEAEVLSATGEKDKARVAFNAAISAARSSKFVHEQGLACEMAAIHSLKHGDKEDALNLLEQAKDCYIIWGSDMKVHAVSKQLEKIRSKD